MKSHSVKKTKKSSTQNRGSNACGALWLELSSDALDHSAILTIFWTKSSKRRIYPKNSFPRRGQIFRHLRKKWLLTVRLLSVRVPWHANILAAPECPTTGPGLAGPHQVTLSASTTSWLDRAWSLFVWLGKSGLAVAALLTLCLICWCVFVQWTPIDSTTGLPRLLFFKSVIGIYRQTLHTQSNPPMFPCFHGSCFCQFLCSWFLTLCENLCCIFAFFVPWPCFSCVSAVF